MSSGITKTEPAERSPTGERKDSPSPALRRDKYKPKPAVFSAQGAELPEWARGGKTRALVVWALMGKEADSFLPVPLPAHSHGKLLEQQRGS